MTQEQFASQWNTIKGKVKEKWTKLSDAEINQVNGKRDTLVSLIQKKYGYPKDRAEQELTQLEKTIPAGMKGGQHQFAQKEMAGQFGATGNPKQQNPQSKQNPQAKQNQDRQNPQDKKHKR